MSKKIVTAWCENHTGPGWANQLVWYIWRDQRTGALHQDCMQPEEWGRSADLSVLFEIDAVISAQVMRAVRKELEG